MKKNYPGLLPPVYIFKKKSICHFERVWSLSQILCLIWCLLRNGLWGLCRLPGLGVQGGVAVSGAVWSASTQLPPGEGAGVLHPTPTWPERACQWLGFCAWWVAWSSHFQIQLPTTFHDIPYPLVVGTGWAPFFLSNRSLSDALSLVHAGSDLDPGVSCRACVLFDTKSLWTEGSRWIHEDSGEADKLPLEKGGWENGPREWEQIYTRPWENVWSSVYIVDIHNCSALPFRGWMDGTRPLLCSL